MSDEGESGLSLSEKLAGASFPRPVGRAAHSNHHLPFRSWCGHCIRGKGKDTPHRRQAEMPEVLQSIRASCSRARRGVATSRRSW